jgi:hypothetical protein
MGFAVTPDTIAHVAREVGEKTIISRAGGAPTLAVGMADFQPSVRRRRDEGVLVSLRDPVRGAVHPDSGRCGRVPGVSCCRI